MKDFAGKVAVVTGGAGGIGKALVRALLDEGVRVVVADVEAPVLEETIAEFKQGDAQIEGRVTDVSDNESVRALADHVFD